MSWEVRLTARAERDIAALPPKHQAAVVNYIFDRLPQDPGRMSKPLKGEFTGLRSARVGPNIRVLFRWLRDGWIEVDRVNYRGDVYRPR